MNLEDMYLVLSAVSGGRGAEHPAVLRCLRASGAVDGTLLTEEVVEKAFERLAPNREPLSLTQFIQLLGILARETKRDVKTFYDRFLTVRQTFVDEVQSRYDTPEGRRRYS